MPKAKKTAAPKRILKLVKTTPKKAAPKKMSGATAPLKKSMKKSTGTPKKVNAKKTASVGTNPIRKLLEMKEARRKQAATDAQNGHSHQYGGQDSKMPAQHFKFSRFAGPRRRVA